MTLGRFSRRRRGSAGRGLLGRCQPRYSVGQVHPGRAGRLNTEREDAERPPRALLPHGSRRCGPRPQVVGAAPRRAPRRPVAEVVRPPRRGHSRRGPDPRLPALRRHHHGPPRPHDRRRHQQDGTGTQDAAPPPRPGRNSIGTRRTSSDAQRGDLGGFRCCVDRPQAAASLMVELCDVMSCCFV